MSKYKAARARSAVAKAAQLLRARSSSSTSSYGPPANRGFYGAYSLRGRAELKFVDVTANNVAVTTTWQGVLINGIAQGADFNQRIGRKSQMKSILFNGNFFPTASTANAYQGIYMRTVIVYDTQPNSGTFPTGTDIFASNDPNSPLNLNNRDRFQVLIDVRKQIGSYLFNELLLWRQDHLKILIGTSTRSVTKKQCFLVLLQRLVQSQQVQCIYSILVTSTVYQ